MSSVRFCQNGTNDMVQSRWRFLFFLGYGKQKFIEKIKSIIKHIQGQVLFVCFVLFRTNNVQAFKEIFGKN